MWHKNWYQTPFAKTSSRQGIKLISVVSLRKYMSKHVDMCGFNVYHKDVTMLLAVIMCHLAPFAQGLGSACPTLNQRA